MSDDPELPPDPSPRVAVLIWWDPDTNEIDYEAPGMSVFDAVGVMTIALELAAQHLPQPLYDDPELEDE